MATELELGSRFDIVEKKAVNNDDNYSFHNNYEYYQELQRSNVHAPDILLKDGHEIDKGSFFGHPYLDESLILFQSDGKQKLYKDGELCAIGDHISFAKDFYVMADNQQLHFFNAKTQQEMFTVKGLEFGGHNAEHKLIKVDNTVWKFSDNKVLPYQDGQAYLPFETLDFQLSVSGALRGDDIIQSYETVKSSTQNFVFVDENGKATTLDSVRGHAKEDMFSPEHLFQLYRDEIYSYSALSHSSMYGENSLKHIQASKKERISALRDVYKILFKKDIDKNNNTSIFETLAQDVSSHFAALWDLYPDEFLKKQEFNKQEFNFNRIRGKYQSDEYLPFMAHFVGLHPEYVSQGGYERKYLVRMIEKQPDLLDKLLKSSLRDSLMESDARSKINQSLQQQGKNLYHLEDFSIAPNKKFLQELQAYGFGNHDTALKKLIEDIDKSTGFYRNDFVFENAKKLLKQLIAEDKEVVDRNVDAIFYGSWAKLVELNIVKTPRIIEKLNDIAQQNVDMYGHVPPGLVNLYEKGILKPKQKAYPALDVIRYGKNKTDISLDSNYQKLKLDFSDCRAVARAYHLSCDSKTTFLNEMLIYGRAEAAAFALANGASPFQKIEFAHGKKTGMPFTGFFLRAKNNNYKGVKELMVDIAKYLPVDKGPKIIGDIEKSLGQTLRQDSYVTGVFAEMRQNLGKNVPQKQNENSENTEQKFAAFYALPQEKLDEIDERNRILKGQNIDEYKTLFALYDSFFLDGYRVPYSPENIERLELSIKAQEEEKQAQKSAEEKAKEAPQVNQSKPKLKTVGPADLAAMLNSKEMD